LVPPTKHFSHTFITPWHTHLSPQTHPPTTHPQKGTYPPHHIVERHNLRAILPVESFPVTLEDFSWESWANGENAPVTITTYMYMHANQQESLPPFHMVCWTYIALKSNYYVYCMEAK